MSLINDALKRASEAQGQAQTRPRGPKGIEDLPVPMTPVSARERPAWVPVAGISLIIAALLGASGFFFAKWWKERQAWQPYAETPEDEAATNAAPGAKPPPDARPTQVATRVPIVAPATTNPPVGTNAEVTIVPPTKPVAPEPPPAKATNPVVAIVTPPARPPDPVIPPTVVNPPPETKVETHPVEVVPPVKPTPPPHPGNLKKGDAVEFPELKLQGISRGKKKTFATVNGKTLALGDRIEGALLLKIETDSVIFEKGGARRELFLLR